MIRFLVRAAIFFASAAIGLFVADLVLDDMSVGVAAFLWTVLIFTVLQSLFAPFLVKSTHRNAPALLGGVGLFSTFLALLITSWIVDDLTITGLSTWIIASLIVWLVTMFASLLLPIILVKMGVEHARDNNN